MMTCSANSVEETVCPEMELLNQACLDLVVQIEELKKENARLKEQVKREVRQGGSEPG